MHRLLERQLRRHQIDPLQLPAECRVLLSEINDAYEQNDSDRALLMRSLEIATEEQATRARELQQRNHDLAAAQAAASHMAGQLQTAIDGARMGTWSWNPSTGETTLSPRFCHIFGIIHGDSHPLDKLVSALYPADRVRFAIGLESVESAHEFAQHVRFQHPNGDLRWLRFLGKLDPCTHWMHGIVRDITDEVKGSHLRDMMAAIVNSASVAIASTNAEGHLQTWNEGAARLFGISVNEAIGKHLRIIALPENWEQLDADIALATTGDIPAPLETTYQHPNGERLTIVIHISPIRDPHSAIEGFSVVVQDISARVNAARMEAERNALAVSISKLEDAMAVVAHELRTPLAGIRATVELMLDRAACMRTDNYLRSVLESVVQTSRVVNDLLEITRLHSGHANWHWEKFDVATAMDTAINCLGVAARADTIRFHAIVDPPEMEMLGDRDAVMRLIVNLTNNALKFTPHGIVRVEITPLTDEAGLQFVHIVVSDTGKGMSQEILEKLGKPFALNSGLVGDNYSGGTGLGVAISKGIVEAHGGRILVKSECNHGTTVDVLLRSDLAEPATVHLPTSVISAPHDQEIII